MAAKKLGYDAAEVVADEVVRDLRDTLERYNLDMTKEDYAYVEEGLRLVLGTKCYKIKGPSKPPLDEILALNLKL